jgi:hypothetical protein
MGFSAYRAREIGAGRSWQLALLALLAVLGVACNGGGSAGPASPVGAPSAVAPATLGSIPLNCESATELWPQHPGPWPVAFGTSPVWIRNLSTISGASAALIPLYPKSLTNWGYSQKLLWIVEPGFRRTVTVVARNISTGKPAYLSAGNAAPSTKLVLDPEHPGIPSSGDPSATDPQLRYAEFPAEIFIDGAGCVEFTATWDTGSWSGTVAAGQGG